MRKLKNFLLVFILAVLIVSCGAPEEKGLIGTHENCTRTSSSVSCTGYYDRVVGENAKSYDDIFFEGESAIYLDITISSSENPMSFAVKQFGIEEEWKTVMVDPLKPGRFKGWVIPDANGKLVIKYLQDQKNATGRVDYTFIVNR